MNKTRKALLAGALGFSAVVPVVAIGAGVASASPTGCYAIMTNNRTGYTVCSGGTGTQHATVYCKRLFWTGGRWVSGPERSAGQQSWVGCSSTEVINYIGWTTNG